MLNDLTFQKLKKEYIESFDATIKENHDHLLKLRRLCDYLDSKGIRMPKPKWKFIYDDYSTWSHLPGRVIRDDSGKAIRHKAYINHAFKYKHLL